MPPTKRRVRASPTGSCPPVNRSSTAWSPTVRPVDQRDDEPHDDRHGAGQEAHRRTVLHGGVCVEQVQRDLRHDDDRQAEHPCGERVAHHAEQPPSPRHRSRLTGARQPWRAAQAPRHDQREQRPENGSEGVHEQITDVEHAVGARVEAPDPGELRELDDPRQREAYGEGRGDAPAAEHADEEPEGHEQQHVQEQLRDGGIRGRGAAAAGDGRAHLVGEHRHVHVDARAADRVGIGQRQQRVGPDRHHGDQRATPEQEPAHAESAAPAEAQRDERHEHQHRDDQPEGDRDRGEEDPVLHASSVPADAAARCRDRIKGVSSRSFLARSTTGRRGGAWIP